MIYLGDKKIDTVYLGDKKLSKIYLGDKLVWEGCPEGYVIGELIETDDVTNNAMHTQPMYTQSKRKVALTLEK